MTDREKLYFLIQDSKESRWFPNNEEMLKLTDHLIANGVTVQMTNKPPTKPVHIRGISDEELAKQLVEFEDEEYYAGVAHLFFGIMDGQKYLKKPQ